MRFKRRCFASVLSVFALVACSNDEPTPLPVGYFRIDLPEPKYQTKEIDCPFEFAHAQTSRLEFYESGKGGAQCWFDIFYPQLNARIHFTYKEVNGTLREFIEESRAMAYEHHIKASRIETKVIDKPNGVHGLVFELDGNVASPYQFYLTDSTNHFLRASLYFEAKPNKDSIQPVLAHIIKDLEHLVSTFEWK